MASYRFESTDSFHFPFSVTIASNIITGIMNRNKTTKIVGDRNTPRARTAGYFLPVSDSVVSVILGQELGLNFPKAIQHPVIATYFQRVCERCMSVGINIAWSPFGWYFVRVATSDSHMINPESVYNLDDYVDQVPNSEIPEHLRR